MTKTNATYKSSFIRPSQADEEFKPKAQKAEQAADAYASTSPDAYKSLLKGNFKAEALDGGCLSEMREAEEGTNSYGSGVDYDRYIQDLISSRMPGPTRKLPARDTVGDIPNVPDLQDDILSKSNLEDQMEPVVERYAALEKVLVTMYNNLLIALDSRNSWRMTAGEIRDMTAYRDKLSETLSNCRMELEEARELLRAQREREAEYRASSSVDDILEVDDDL